MKDAAFETKASRRDATLDGISPNEFRIATDAQHRLRSLADFARITDPAKIVKASMTNERHILREHIAIIENWMDQLWVRLKD